MAFDPYAPAPPELETGMITQNPLTPGKLAAGLGAAVAAPFALPALALAGTSLAGSAQASPSPVVPAAPPPVPAGLPPAPQPTPPPVAAPSPRGGGGGLPGVNAATPGMPTAPGSMEGDLTAAGQKAVQGVRQVQEAEGAASDQIAKAQQGLSDLQGEQAEELRQRQQQTREVHAELDKQDAANLKTARDYTIPDFWKGHEGAQVGSIIAMAMGSIAQGILGGQNGAAMLVNKKVDDYFHRQKDKVDNLYRYAESQGKLNDATRHRYVQDLLNLQQQHTAVNQSVISHIKSVEAQNQGNINRASTDSLIAQLEQKNLKQIEDHRNLSFEQQMKVRGQEQAERAQREANSIARGNLALQRQELALKAAGGIGGHAPTGEMLKSQGFADTARANDQIISQTPISSKGMETILTDMQREAMFKEGGVGRSIAQTLGAWKTIEQKLSPQDQRALLAARQFINADLRRESGAAISPVEFQSAFARYFPMVGDSADTIRQKAANRQQSIHSMDVAGGMARGGNPVTVGQQTGGASAQGQPPIGTRATSGGKPIVMTANGWQLAQ